MKVTDLNGCQIEVTDLDKAIEQTEYFKDAHHLPPSESDQRRQAYWCDMYQKLIGLKKQTVQHKIVFKQEKQESFTEVP